MRFLALLLQFRVGIRLNNHLPRIGVNEGVRIPLFRFKIMFITTRIANHKVLVLAITNFKEVYIMDMTTTPCFDVAMLVDEALKFRYIGCVHITINISACDEHWTWAMMRQYNDILVFVQFNKFLNLGKCDIEPLQ